MARAKVQWGFHILVGEAVWSRGRDNQWREQQEHSAHRGRPSILILRSLLLSSMFPSPTARSFSTLSSPSLSFLFPSFSSLSLYFLSSFPLFSHPPHTRIVCANVCIAYSESMFRPLLLTNAVLLLLYPSMFHLFVIHSILCTVEYKVGARKDTFLQLHYLLPFSIFPSSSSPLFPYFLSPLLFFPPLFPSLCFSCILL